MTGGGGAWEDKLEEIDEKSGLKCRGARSSCPVVGVAADEEGASTAATALGIARTEIDPREGKEGEEGE